MDLKVHICIKLFHLFGTKCLRFYLFVTGLLGDFMFSVSLELVITDSDLLRY